MANEEALEALRGGMRAELESAGLYEEAAAKSQDGLRDFFASRAEEEKRHFNLLLEAWRALGRGEIPAAPAEAPPSAEAARAILDERYLSRIAHDRFLTAAVAASALLEINSVRYYGKKAEEAAVKEVADLFSSLADWEDGHYRELLAIQEELERSWFDANRFEPF
jgi:rubrerythrin